MNKLVRIAGGSALVYAFLAWMMGVLPGIELSQVPGGPGVKPLSPLESEGRDVYVANGCSYCHTQQVRPLNQDKIFGRPSTAGDFKYQTPELLGSERTGPDLTNIGMRQPSPVWQYIHLYNPRAVVPESIMPSFSWLFAVADHAPPGTDPVPLPKPYSPAHGIVAPTHQAQALIAYLMSLKQPPLDIAMASGLAMAAPAIAEPTLPPMSFAPTSPSAYDAEKGAALFTAHCSACHQANGEGLPGAFPPLKGNDVVNDDDGTTHIQVVLQGLHDMKVGGVTYGSAMPPFAGVLSDADIANIVDYERNSWGNHGKTVLVSEVTRQRAIK